MIVLRDRPRVRHTPAVVGNAIVLQCGWSRRDPAVSTPVTKHPAAGPIRGPYHGTGIWEGPRNALVAWLNPKSGGNARDATIPLRDVDGAARLVEGLQLCPVAVAAESSCDEVAQRPGIFVGMHMPGVVHIDTVLPKQRLKRVV